MAFSYPTAPQSPDQVDVYHGVSVSDLYRPLEDANAPATQAWVEAENAITSAYLASVPARDAIKSRLTQLWDYEKFGMPSKKGSRYFYSKNNGLQNQFVLYVADNLHDDGRVLLDPNGLSPDGTIALSGMAISDDGNLLAYGISHSGSDWQEWRVRDITTGDDLPDLVQWAKNTGASWTKDNKGFFYSRYDAPEEGAALQAVNYYKKLYYHRVGQSQEQDTLVYDRPDHKEWGFSGGVTDDGRYLTITVYEGTERKNRIFLKDLMSPNGETNGAGAVLNNDVIEFLPTPDAEYSVLDNDGSLFYIGTDKDAPFGRVVAIDASAANPSDPANWREVLPESGDTLQSASLFGDKWYVGYLKDARSQIKIFGLDGTFERELELPGVGSAGGFGGKRDATETFYSFASYTAPPTIYRYDLQTGTSEVYKKAGVAFDPDQYETTQVFFESRDGTRVPMFITYKKGIEKNGQNPTYLYAYGGFTISLTPNFSVSALTWMEMGGVYAVANLRGGGEYGKAWHDNGKLTKKQNVFDDFIAAAEYLIHENYTSKEKLAIAGGSNGGLLVGACLTQRPDLYGAALPAVGVMDMLRFNKFTIGWMWASDYGNPDENEADFKANYAYSPYHNLKSGTTYPPTLVTTSDHDDRVVPAHSYKFAAALQSAQAPDGPPVLIRIETRAGHGAGKPTAKIIEEASDIYAFLVKSLNVELPEGFGK